MPTPALVHAPTCTTVEEGIRNSLHITFIPALGAQTVRIVIWEACQWCGATQPYADGREPERRFHRSWKAKLAVWIATWEHRTGLWDGSSSVR